MAQQLHSAIKAVKKIASAQKSAASDEARVSVEEVCSELADLYLNVVPRAMSELRVEFRAHRAGDLSMPQFRVLASVSTGRKSNKELADLIGVNVTTMSRMIQGLEEQGLIEKSSVDSDRRVVSIELSKPGRKLFGRIRGKTRDSLAAKLLALSARDRQLLKQGFEVLFQSLKSEF